MPSPTLINYINSIIQQWNIQFESICFPGLKGTACPVPFFGKIESDKPLVFTIGSNPSDREFLSSGKPVVPVRFLDPSKPYTANDLFDACSLYFSNNRNPYKGWFGKEGGARIEGFLNVINPEASYSGHRDRQAVHVDLIPFPTFSKYTCFKKCHPALVSTMSLLGKTLLDILINEYHPQEIICIGREACEEWLTHIGKHTTAGHSFDYYKGTIYGVKAFGTSLYFPNSYGSTPSDWKKDIVPLM